MFSISCFQLCEKWKPLIIIAANNNSDYMCKWVGLPYADCTWEDGDLISRLFQAKVDAYHARQKSHRIPTKLSKVRQQKKLHVKNFGYVWAREKKIYLCNNLKVAFCFLEFRFVVEVRQTFLIGQILQRKIIVHVRKLLSRHLLIFFL